MTRHGQKRYTRRDFIKAAAAGAGARIVGLDSLIAGPRQAAGPKKKIPVGVQLYSVRQAASKDLEALCCFLGRDGWYYTESGFIGFNRDHPKSSLFFKNYVHVPIVGTIFTQPGWHDCFVFDAVRHVMGNGPEFVNLAAKVPHGHMHPFQITAPGEYMWHLKGNRKDSGELRPEDLKRE